MRGTLCRLARSGTLAGPNIVQIRSGTFYREHPATSVQHDSTSNPSLFPGLTFDLPATPQTDVGQPNRKDQHWAVIGSTDGTVFLEILQGAHICIPPHARSFPHLSSDEIDKKDHKLRNPARAIQYVGFNTGRGQSMGSGIRGAYLSARYESRREETDWSVLQYLKGETELNPSEKDNKHVNSRLLDKVIADLRLQKLVDMPVSNLSNGQTRRARIAKALLNEPEVLLLDEPFMGLDPPTLVSLSPLLRELSYRSSPLLILGLRPQDPIPDWITHLVVLGHNHRVALMGPKSQVLFSLFRWTDLSNREHSSSARTRLDTEMANRMTRAYGHPLADAGSELNARGIMPFAAGAVARALSDFVDKNGKVIVEKLDSEGQTLWQAADRKSSEERTLQDLLVLTTNIPDVVSLSSHEESESRPVSSLSPASVLASESRAVGKPIIELQSVVIKYGDKVVLGHGPPQPGHDAPGLNLNICEGTRLALLGPNGSGKTTFLSLLTSDHPQSYSLPIKFFGRSRLPALGKPGLSLWEIQSRIGHSAPEVHGFFPKTLSIRRTLESAWSATPIQRAKLTQDQIDMVDIFLRWWEPELRPNWTTEETNTSEESLTEEGPRDLDSIEALKQQSYPPFPSQNLTATKSDLSWATNDDSRFGVLPFGVQRLLLLLRSVIKQPDIVILDEAFSGLSAEMRDKAMCWLEYGETRFLQPRLISSSNSASSSNSEDDSARWKMTEVPNRRVEVENTLTGSSSSPNQTQYLFKGLTSSQALVVVSHVKEEIPAFVDEYIRLPSEEEVTELGKSIEMGRCDGGKIRTAKGWNEVWQLR